MQIKSVLFDKRIEAFNIMIEMRIGDYLNFAYDIVDKNEFQRRKVIKAKIREILKEDLQKGCLLPSIVLAAYGNHVTETSFSLLPANALDIIQSSIAERKILIIDGLQRTFVMLALREELQAKGDQASLDRFLNNIIRSEVYVGLKRMGLLYRMITLNTGQTTMSTRHLMEILYHDYLNSGFHGIHLIQDKDGKVPAMNTVEFDFKEILDGFNSFIEKDEGIINRTEILDNIKSLDVLKDEVYSDRDTFKEFIFVFKKLLDTLLNKSNDWKLNPDYFTVSGMEIKGHPFGRSVVEIFKKSQSLTGFGAAIGQMKDTRGLTIVDVSNLIEKLSTDNEDWDAAFATIIVHIDIINNKSNKIGNDQRFYFRTFYRALFNTESDQHLNVIKAAEYASNRTREDRL